MWAWLYFLMPWVKMLSVQFQCPALNRFHTACIMALQCVRISRRKCQLKANWEILALIHNFLLTLWYFWVQHSHFPTKKTRIECFQKEIKRNFKSKILTLPPRIVRACVGELTHVNYRRLCCQIAWPNIIWSCFGCVYVIFIFWE